MTNPMQEKVDAYIGEALAYGQMMVDGKPWDQVEPLYVDYYNRLESESDIVKFYVAAASIEITEMAIEIYGQMDDLQFSLVSTLATEAIPQDMTVSKRGIELTEKNAKGLISPRVAFYYSALKSLPDVDAENPKKAVQAMRDASKQPKP